MLKLNFTFSKYFKNTFVTNSFWSLLGSFTSKGINFIVISWIARILGPEDFGEYNVIQSTVGAFGTLSGLGLGLAATKLVAEYRDKDIEKVGRITSTLYLLSIVASFTVAIGFFSLAPLVSKNILNNGNLTLLLQITSIIVVFDSLNGVQNGVLSGLGAFKEISFIGIIVGIATSPLLVFGAFYFGLTGVTVTLLLSRLINVLVNIIYLNRRCKIHAISVAPQMNKDVLKSIFSIGIPSFLSSFSTSPVNFVSTSIFVNQPLGYLYLGNYSAVVQLRSLVLLLPDSVGNVIMSQLANAFGNNNILRFKRTIIVAFLGNLVLSVLPSILLFIFASFFQNIFGAQFELSNTLIFVVLSTGVLVALTNAVGYIFICSNLVWYDFILRIFWGVALILIIIIYGKYHGTVGYATSIFGASVSHIIAQLIVLVVKLKFNYTR